ncbi:hypothetical protein BST83_12355 [Polaribacter filamentus]|jgi:hypothetical protein|uniref:Uncharacterized protein n=1 Tax=Polaribacter filamentus TaxID=53483 RepID=A0A2S7KYW5_9FLAO|nr:hypothetical protein BST83_12355 [Polaribacter filamentus]|tara:strand:- start:1602 stop:1952 length:351 start_codon:yes stop_codon:yes gene_type:complete
MCKKLEPVSKNNYGEIYYCNDCDVHHVLFNNFHFILNKKQINALRKCIISIDITYWETQFKYTTIKRKIPIPTCQENLILIFNKHEFDAFKSLFSKQSNTSKVLTADEIEYNFILN